MLQLADAAYRCPGEAYEISRAVHLGRLTAGHLACRDCPQRHDTTGLPRRIVARLAEASRLYDSPLWHDDGLAGVCGDALTATVVRNVAAAFALWLRRRQTANVRIAAETPTVVLAGDERPATAELVAAAADGLRYAGCEAIDLGGATSASLTQAIHRLGADGGLLVGNPHMQTQAAGLKFWHASAQPLSAGAADAERLLDDVRKISEEQLTRPTRRYGSWQRAAADEPYLESLRPYFHALRPLRFDVAAASPALRRYLEKLLSHVGCQAIFTGSKQPVESRVHFGIAIDGDGECCQLSDEQGRPVAWDRTLALLASELLREHPGGTVVVGGELTPAAARHISTAGGQLHTVGATRAAMDRALRTTLASTSPAILGGDPSGRFWFAADAGPSADALQVLALVLTILSRSDRPLSQWVEESSKSEARNPKQIPSTKVSIIQTHSSAVSSL